MTLAALVGAAWWARARFFPPSLEAEARRALDCEEAADAGCLQGYVRDPESRAYDLTRDRLAHLLRDYVNPAFSKAKGTPDVESTPSRETGTLQYTRRWARTGGAEEPLQRTMTVAATPEGAKSPRIVRDMVLDVWYARYRRPEDGNHYQTYIRGVDHDAARLTQLGLVGLYDEETDRIEPWTAVRSAWAAKLRQRNLPVPQD